MIVDPVLDKYKLIEKNINGDFYDIINKFHYCKLIKVIIYIYNYKHKVK